MSKQTYVVAVAHEMAGQHHPVGARLSMTPKQAWTRKVAGTLVTEAEWEAMQVKGPKPRKKASSEPGADSEADKAGAE